MQKFMKRSIVALLFTIFIFTNFAWAEELQGVEAPLSQAFLDWQTRQNKLDVNSNALVEEENEDEEFKNGYVPFPVDLSYLADDLPSEEDSVNGIVNVKATTIPSKYDLRDYNYVTSVKNQNPYGTCWAFASIGAMESNYLKNYGTNKNIDLSEMHLAWFTFINSDTSKRFKNDNTTNPNYDSVLNHGGNIQYPAALYSRLSGPVAESDLPYDISTTKLVTLKDPESSDYTRVLRLRDVFFFSMSTSPNVNESDAQRNIIKQRIMENGSVVANYYHTKNEDYVNKNGSTGSTAYYTTNKSINHAIQIVGWDDNYSRSNFKTNPGMDGAWLIKNSWGPNRFDNGYFWMSYKQYLSEGAAFIVEDANKDMKAYYYDALGWCGSYGWPGSSSQYAANVFQAESDEYLTEIGFMAPNNNMNYEIIIYTNLGTSMPSRPVKTTSPDLTQSGTISYAGYHTIELSNAISLTGGQYFSVIVKMDGINYIPLEKKVSNFSDNAVTETGSFLSYNGTSWVTGATAGGNTCVKAFTVPNLTQTTPKITTSSLPNGTLSKDYSTTLTATGGSITWSLEDNLKLTPGLSLSTGGRLFGTPIKSGDFTFTVIAKNGEGSDKKTFTLTIDETPEFTITSFSGYVGLAFTGALSLSDGESATWTIAKGTFPAGLTLASGTGVISGKPTKAGTSKVSITATTSSAAITEEVTFTIEAKPVKPTISNTSLKNGLVGEYYSDTIAVKGTTPITITAEGVPSGLLLTGPNLSGTPTTAGNYTIKFLATNTATTLDGGTPVTKNVRLVIKAHAPNISVASQLPDGKVGEKYSYAFTDVSGDSSTWTASGLPRGLILAPQTGILSGEPLKAGNYKITVKAVNNGGRDSKKTNLTIIEAPALALTKLKDGKTGSNYSVNLRATGSTPISWNITGLPDGFKVTSDEKRGTAKITGVPTKAQTYTVNIVLKNSAGSSTTSFDLKITGVAPRITASLPKANVGKNYSALITAKGSMPIDISYSIPESDQTKFGISELDDIGLTFDTLSEVASASITGTPTQSVKNLPIDITASNDAGTVTKKVKLTASGTRPAFISPSMATTNVIATAGSAISIDFTVTGTKEITLTATKADGFTFTQSGDYNATLSGTAPSKEGRTTITVTAQNADGKAVRKVVIQTKTVPAITTTSLPNGTVKKSYSAKIAATGSKTIKWVVTSSDLPKGITFNNGNLRGKTETAGDYSITLTASNDVGTDTKTFSFSIADSAAKSVEEANEIPQSESESESKFETEPKENENSENESAESEEKSQEAKIIYGEAQKLSQAAIQKISDSGYTVILELPEIQVTQSGQYDITLESGDAIELGENAITGAKLFYFARPQGQESQDDEICEFYDEDGQEIANVPENHKVKISAWYNEGVIYRPIICIEKK